jgi:hypothetical protein
MSVTITDNTSQIQVSGAYKDFTSGSGSTTTVIQYDSGEAPISGDAGRFLMWRVDTSATGTWQIRYIESATSNSVTVGDGGFSSAPPSGAEFRMSSNLQDIKDEINNANKLRLSSTNGTHYEFVNREWKLISGAFLADVDKSIGMTNKNSSQWSPSAFQVGTECAVQFGRLLGGEANDSVETTQGCRLALSSTNQSKLIFGVKANGDSADEYDALGCILNFYGCQIEASHGANPLFIRAGGALRMIGTIVDGDIGGRFYSDATELVDCRFSGNSSGGHAWSSATSPTRDIDNVFFYDNNTAIKAYQNFDATFKNCRFSDSNTKIIQADANANLNFKFIDCTTFADGKISDNKGNYTQGKSINYEITDSSGVGQSDVLVAVYDKDRLLQTAIQSSSSGVVSEIQAIFFNKPHQSGASNLAPFDIRVRKYGYAYLGFQSAVSEPIKQEIRLVDNPNLVSTKTEAQAISGISLNFATSTLTLTEDHSAQALYDYYQYQLGESANMQYAEDFIKSGSSFNLGDWDLVVDGCTYTGDITTSGSITRLNDGKILGSATDASGTTVLLPWEVRNVEATTRLQLYNITQSSLVVTQKLSGTAGNYVDASGTYEQSEIAVGDVVRLRCTCVVGAEAMLPVEITGVATTTGITFAVDQVADGVYNSNGIDGSTVSTLTADYSSPMGVDVSDADGTASVKEMYAFFVYSTTTVDGVEEWFGGMRAIDNANYEIITANADIKVQNIGSNAVVVTDGRLYRDDQASVLYAENGDKPISMDSGALTTNVQPMVESALNNNAKVGSIDKNTKIIPALL